MASSTLATIDGEPRLPMEIMLRVLHYVSNDYPIELPSFALSNLAIYQECSPLMRYHRLKLSVDEIRVCGAFFDDILTDPRLSRHVLHMDLSTSFPGLEACSNQDWEHLMKIAAMIRERLPSGPWATFSDIVVKLTEKECLGDVQRHLLRYVCCIAPLYSPCFMEL